MGFLFLKFITPEIALIEVANSGYTLNDHCRAMADNP